MLSKIYSIVLLIILASCGSIDKSESAQLITNEAAQQSIFNSLVKLTQNIIPEDKLNDSIAFLILPVQASCPACRKKTIDSIVKHKDDLPDNHFIVISARAGRKTISSFFKEQKKQLPLIEGRLFLDSTNQAFSYELYEDKPTMYYAFNRKAYKKVSSIPATVKEDLNQFFSGNHHVEQITQKK